MQGKNKIRWSHVMATIVLFVGVRIAGKSVFYDPLMAFYHDPGFMQEMLPKTETWKYAMSLTLRFALNSAISLWLIYAVFAEKEFIRVAVAVMAVVLGVALPLVLYLVNEGGPDTYLTLFYTRRILIHPMLVLLLIPAFYFYRISKKTSY